MSGNVLHKKDLLLGGLILKAYFLFLQEAYHLLVNGLRLQRAAMTQSFRFDITRMFPDPGNGAAVVHWRDVIGFIMEHQGRNLDLRSE